MLGVVDVCGLGGVGSVCVVLFPTVLLFSILALVNDSTITLPKASEKAPSASVAMDARQAQVTPRDWGIQQQWLSNDDDGEVGCPFLMMACF